jgi:hypothetical protein
LKVDNDDVSEMIKDRKKVNEEKILTATRMLRFEVKKR